MKTAEQPGYICLHAKIQPQNMGAIPNSKICSEIPSHCNPHGPGFAVCLAFLAGKRMAGIWKPVRPYNKFPLSKAGNDSFFYSVLTKFLRKLTNQSAGKIQMNAVPFPSSLAADICP